MESPCASWGYFKRNDDGSFCDCAEEDALDFALSRAYDDIGDLIRGVSLSSTVTFRRDDGSVWKKKLTVADSAEIIGYRTGRRSRFADEIGSIDVSPEKIAHIRQGAEAEDVLSNEERHAVRQLIRDAIASAYHSADEECIFDPNNPDIPTI